MFYWVIAQFESNIYVGKLINLFCDLEQIKYENIKTLSRLMKCWLLMSSLKFWLVNSMALSNNSVM